MARKTQSLGINISTAQARLRKLILFKLVQELGYDICFRCNQKIEKIKDLSIDHKIHWNGDSELFWDLDNIAFSHLKCNCLSRPETKVLSYEERIQRLEKGKALRRFNEPENMAWCSGCKEYKSIELFSKNKSKRNGLSSDCKNCKSKRRSKKGE